MPKNTINANFNQIAVTDASDNVLGIRAAIGNVQITGGTSGQALTTNGSGVLSWASPPAALTNNFAALVGVNITVSSTTSPGTTVMTFTIPSAGTWFVNYSMNVWMTNVGAQNDTVLGIYDNTTNAFVAGSSAQLRMTATTVNGGRAQLAQRCILTTTASTVFKISAYSTLAANIQQIRIDNGSGWSSFVQWMKIG